MQGSKSKKWADALDRALHRESKGKGSAKWLDVIANRLVAEAAAGDVTAIKEVGDRIDGKPKQQTDITSGGDKIAPAFVELVAVLPDDDDSDGE
jgi:hypothetical protein